MLQTYQGVIKQGAVRLSSNVDWPDGTRVYITAIPTLDERYARRKAATWLAENVGDQLMPGIATLVRQGQRLVWSFPVLLGSPFDEPRGPLGYVDVDAEAGNVTSQGIVYLQAELRRLLGTHPLAGTPHSRITRLRSRNLKVAYQKATGLRDLSH